MTTEGIFALLKTADFGAYAMSLDQRIVFWNEGAQRILGFSADEVIGRRCFEVVAGLAPGGITAACASGCPSIRALRAGDIPHAPVMQLLSASGARKEVLLTPLVVSVPGDPAPLVVHLFDDRFDSELTGKAADSVRSGLQTKGAQVVSDDPGAMPSTPQVRKLTARELEVLRLVALGRGTRQIAEELGISLHTVRNHVRHFRRKLNATTKLDAVLTAMRHGILERF